MKGKKISFKDYWFAKPEDERQKEFIKKHDGVKYDDVAGNGDDVYTGSNVKTVNRKAERHGYGPESVNEDNFDYWADKERKYHEAVARGDHLSAKKWGELISPHKINQRRKEIEASKSANVNEGTFRGHYISDGDHKSDIRQHIAAAKEFGVDAKLVRKQKSFGNPNVFHYTGTGKNVVDFLNSTPNSPLHPDDTFSEHDLKKMKVKERSSNVNEELLDRYVAQLDELSKKTLGSYIKAASSNYDGLYSNGWLDARMAYDQNLKQGEPGSTGNRERVRKAMRRHHQITNRREQGINRAVNRLTKEEQQLDQSSMMSDTHNITKVKKPSLVKKAINTADGGARHINRLWNSVPRA